MKNITLTRPAVCADCGCELPAGTTVRFYRNDKIYCLTTHAAQPTA